MQKVCATQTQIEYKSSGPTRSGKQVQARFRVNGKIRCWTLYPSMAAEFRKQFKQGGALRERVVFQMLASLSTGHGSAQLRELAKSIEAQRLCARALAEAARVDPTDVRDAAARAKAERALAAWARSALDHGMTDERLREIFEEAIVEHTISS